MVLLVEDDLRNKGRNKVYILVLKCVGHSSCLLVGNYLHDFWQKLVAYKKFLVLYQNKNTLVLLALTIFILY